MHSIVNAIEDTGALAPWLFVALFIAASLLMVWRLEIMSAGGFEGTVLGTLITPYCTGMGNLIFAFEAAAGKFSGAEVMTNSLVNNATNMTLLIGLPAIFWGMKVLPGGEAKKKKNKQRELNRLSLLLTLLAVLFFTGATWALAGRGGLDRSDGLVLVGLFLFWQCFHVFEVLKGNLQKSKSFHWVLWLNLALLGVGAYAQYISIDWLVNWLSHKHAGFISARHMGWLSGWLMVLPNGILAMYYGWRGNPETVYASQVGDGHVSIPLCVGIVALYKSVSIPAFFQTGVTILIAATLAHIFFIGFFGRLPRLVGWVLVAVYGFFLLKCFPH